MYQMDECVQRVDFGRVLRRYVVASVCALVWTFSSSCSVDSVPGIEGTIFRFSSKTTFAYSPDSGVTVDLALGRILMEPFIASEGPGGTIMLTIRNGIAKDFISDSLLYSKSTLGRYTPFESRFELIPSLADTTFFCRSLDYNSTENQYLFSGRPGEGREDGLYVLDTTFSTIRSHVPLMQETLSANIVGVSKAFSLSNGNILLDWYDVEGSSIVLELDVHEKTYCDVLKSEGKLRALSPSRNFAIITNPTEIFLYNTLEKSSRLLSLETRGQVRFILAYCFSPDDRYVAYSVRENDFRNTIRLHIYDLQEGKDYRTVPIGAGPLLWLPIEPPAELLETANWW
jgi:hypothetical protein